MSRQSRRFVLAGKQFLACAGVADGAVGGSGLGRGECVGDRCEELGVFGGDGDAEDTGAGAEFDQGVGHGVGVAVQDDSGGGQVVRRVAPNTQS